MQFRDWAVWRIDWPTLWVYAWMAQFVAIEYLTSRVSPVTGWQGQMITEHWRPVFHAAPITWWLALGVYLWLGPHMLFPALERWLAKVVGG